MAETAKLSDRDVTRDSPEPKHGNPAEGLAPTESVIGVKVGSEASVASGTDPVLPAVAGNIAELTKVRNKDLQERDKKELEKRGPIVGVHTLSASFEGLMMVEVDGREPEPRVGSYTGGMIAKFTLRAPTKKEYETHTPGALPGPEAVQRPGVTSRNAG